MARTSFLLNEQWEKIGPLLPQLKSRGRPWRSNREVFEGILWVLRTGARWKDRLPGTLATVAHAVAAGARVVRAHDVAETIDVVRLTEALRRRR